MGWDTNTQQASFQDGLQAQRILEGILKNRKLDVSHASLLPHLA
jgi:hypothetical protein